MLSKEIKEDPDAETKAIKLVAQSIACIPDKIRANKYIVYLSNKFSIDIDLIKAYIKECKIPAKNLTPLIDGLTGIAEALELVNPDAPKILLTDSPQIFHENWGEAPIVLFTGTPSMDDIQTLRSSATTIEYKGNISAKKGSEPKSIMFLKSLFRAKCDLNIETTETDKPVVQSFLNFYVSYCSDKCKLEEAYKTEIIKQVAFIASFTNNADAVGFACMLGVILVVIDYITGISASLYEGKGITSKKLRWSFAKLAVYVTVVIGTLTIGVILHLIDTITNESNTSILIFTLTCVKFEAYIIAWIETVSNIENLRRIFSKNLFLKYIHWILSVEIIKKIPKLSEFLKEQKNEK